MLWIWNLLAGCNIKIYNMITVGVIKTFMNMTIILITVTVNADTFWIREAQIKYKMDTVLYKTVTQSKRKEAELNSVAVRIKTKM